MPERAYSGVAPDVFATAAVPPQFHIVARTSATELPDEDHLVSGAIQAAHCPMALVPHDDVFELAEYGLAGHLHLGEVSPVRECEVDRCRLAVRRNQPEDVLFELGEFVAVHLARRH